MALGVRSGSGSVTDNGGDTSITVTKPSGAATDDWWVVWLKTPDSTTTVTTPTGWTAHPDSPVDMTSPQHKLWAFYLRLDGTEGTSQVFSFNQSRQVLSGTLLVQDATATIDDTAFAAETTTATSHTLPSITTTVADGLIVAGYGSEAAAHTWTPDADYTEYGEASNSANNSLAITARDVTTATTYSSDVTTTDVAVMMAALLIAFRPAAAGGVHDVSPTDDITTTGWASTPLWSKIDDDTASPDGTVVSATAS